MSCSSRVMIDCTPAVATSRNCGPGRIASRSEQVIPAQAGRPATVVLELDGGPRRRDRSPAAGRDDRRECSMPGSSAQSPRLLTADDDTTICSLVLPTTPEGGYEPARGTPVPLGLARDDPRWARPLPWSTAEPRPDPPWLFLGLAGLALINVVVPLLILRLATRRRVWSVRMLLALPAVVAIPMAVFLAFVSVTPSMAGASARQAIAGFGLATLGGLPIVVYVALIGSSLLRRRWRRLVKLAVLSVLATAVAGGFGCGSDRQRMPAIEHYTWSGWHAVIVPGLYLAGVLAMIAWAVRGAWRFVGKRWRRRRAVAMNPS